MHTVGDTVAPVVDRAVGPGPLFTGIPGIRLVHRSYPVEFGPILRACYDAQIDGKFGTLEEGIEYGRSVIQKSGE